MLASYVKLNDAIRVCMTLVLIKQVFCCFAKEMTFITLLLIFESTIVLDME